VHVNTTNAITIYQHQHQHPRESTATQQNGEGNRDERSWGGASTPAAYSMFFITFYLLICRVQTHPPRPADTCPDACSDVSTKTGGHTSRHVRRVHRHHNTRRVFGQPADTRPDMSPPSDVQPCHPTTSPHHHHHLHHQGPARPGASPSTQSRRVSNSTRPDACHPTPHNARPDTCHPTTKDPRVRT
jgi:hypothetical protein